MESIFRAYLLRDQVAVVTGGASGIGLATARELGALGARISLCGRRAEVLEAARSSLDAAGIEVHTATCDIRDPAEVERYVNSVSALWGRIDVLVNNAGGQFPAPAENVSPKGFEAVVRNNLLGTWNMTQAVAVHCMIPARGGRIVNVIAQVVRGFPGMIHTGAARAGVDNMTKTLAVEWARYGIRVNAVAPGVIMTEGLAQYPRELLEEARVATPLKRFGHPKEVSHLIVYLASRHADFITGQSIYIDGGTSLWGDRWPIPDDVPQRGPYEA